LSGSAAGGTRRRVGRVFSLLLVGCLGTGWVSSEAVATDLEGAQAAAALSAADLTPEEAAAALKARGVTESQVRQLVGEKPAGEDPTAAADVDSVEAEPERVEEAPREISEETPPEADEELVPFGYSFFENSPESYRQPAIGPVDPDYPLGPGDTIVLDVWGDTVFRVERKLDLEGGVNLPDVGRVVLAGMTLDEAREQLRRRLSRAYSGFADDEDKATTFLSVTLGDLRVIRVFVVGRARRPGGYDLSAASTVFHSLFFAGGPTQKGSLRDIRVIRGGKEVARLDVYDYLRTGRRKGDIRLENDDTVFIPPTGPRVAVRGEVRQPGLYEMIAGETLADLVELAGGFTEKSYVGRIQIERVLDPAEQEASLDDRKILDLPWDQARSQVMKDGDSVEVFGIPDRMRNFVEIRGEVRRPGRYEWREEQRLTDLLEQAGGLLETAVLERAEIVRTYDDQRHEQIAVDLGKVLAGDGQRDLRMSPRDVVHVHSIWQLKDRGTVSVRGAVRTPGIYELRKNLTLRDLLLQAGGLKENAYTESVEVSRVRPNAEMGMQTTEVFQVPLGANYLETTRGDLRLEPWDNVFVREIPNWELQRNVRIEGEVLFPGVYTLRTPLDKLSDVIARAGGLKETAYPGGFSLVRKKDGIGRIALDLEEALRRPDSNDDLILFDGDSLYVPEEPKTVTVAGAVGYPTSLLYESGKSIGDYVSMAGGTTEEADAGHTRIIYSTGAAARVKRFWFDPEVLPGSTIQVPPKKEEGGVDWGEVFRDTAQILASMATVVLVVDRVAN